MAGRNRVVRVNRVARKLARHYEKLRFAGWEKAKRKRPMRRKESRAREKLIIAYDLETTRIEAGSPKPLYITAFGDDVNVSMRVNNIIHLCEILEQRFLIPDNKGVRFVAWNGNNFDVYLIAAALLHSERFTLRPYLTGSNNLRGLRVDEMVNGKKMSWEFLDGIAMTGLTGVKLAKFLDIFAPDYGKLKGPDFEREEFNAMNSEHVKYAERDSEGLYRGLHRAQQIVMETFGVPLYPTIGNTGIRIFQRNMPIQACVWEPKLVVADVIRDSVMRGGYCQISRKYEGPTWKFDINQAYAAAMRDADLPCGSLIHYEYEHPYVRAAIYRVRGTCKGGRVPFYYKNENRQAVFSPDEITDSWITSIEYQQLKTEGWKLEILDGYFWAETFNMKGFVDRLETLRMNSPGGPSGAQGTMIKAIGNNSYGKTVETLRGMEVVLSRECPDGFAPLSEEDELLQNCWYQFAQPVPREYHQPQIGSFITAHVRMVLRRAILLDVDAWIYADTDCVVYSRPVELPVHPSKYGFWKVEVDGAEYRYIAPKVYASFDGKTKRAKGLNNDKLTMDDFVSWFNGAPPAQDQTQKQNFMRVMRGGEMFVKRHKVGQVL